jgi:DNA-binding NarL/FixJ family response regulator
MSSRSMPARRAEYHASPPDQPGVRGTTAQSGLPQTSSDARVPVALSIVSNSQLLREGLTLLLTPHLDLRLVGSYPSVVSQAAVLPNPSGHVVLLDGSIGRPAVVAWTHRWRALTPTAPVLVLELVNDVEVILGCIEAGAKGYTLQGASAQEVAEAVRLLQQGRALCGPDVAAEVFRRLAAYAGAQAHLSLPSVPLSERELQVLTYIAADYSNQRIADALVIEVRTVKHHVHNILEKLHLHHREEAARLAASQGWLDMSIPDLAPPDR